MNSGLGRIPLTRRTGAERLRLGGTSLEGSLLDFWQWSASDLLTNTARGLLAEYIVAKGLGISTAAVRDAWAPFDLLSPTGIRVEVKSCAYLQSWFQKSFSAISFSTKPSTAWNPDTNLFEGDRRRPADVYVFALLANKDKATLDPLDVSQWEFYVVPTRLLDERHGNRATISLAALHRFGVQPHVFRQLPVAVNDASRYRPA